MINFHYHMVNIPDYSLLFSAPLLVYFRSLCWKSCLTDKLDWRFQLCAHQLIHKPVEQRFSKKACWGPTLSTEMFRFIFSEENTTLCVNVSAMQANCVQQWDVWGAWIWVLHVRRDWKHIFPLKMPDNIQRVIHTYLFLHKSVFHFCEMLALNYCQRQEQKCRSKLKHKGESCRSVTQDPFEHRHSFPFRHKREGKQKKLTKWYYNTWWCNRDVTRSN